MKVLIAEDYPASRRFLRKTLEKMGHEVLSARNGMKAWQAFKDNKINMVITDWMMPEMDGISLCKKIRLAAKKIYVYVIVLTVKDQKKDLVKAFREGADDYICKPFDTEELKSRIKTAERIVGLEEKHQKLERVLREKKKKIEETLKRLQDTQAQMVQSEKLSSIGQLAAGIAHEINNPTGFVSSNLTTLYNYQQEICSMLKHYRELFAVLKDSESNGNLPPSISKLLENIAAFEKKTDIDFVMEDIHGLVEECQEGTGRIKRIISNLTEFAHPGEKKLQVADLNKGIDSTLNIVWNEIKYKAKVTKDYGDLPPVKCYPQQLNQVFMNILINAVQAIREEGKIHISTRAENGHVKIKISDNGSGISRKNVSKIFNPFFTTKKVGKGTGLGLNVAYNIVSKHNGTIHVESELGKGTTFTIRIPLVEKDQEEVFFPENYKVTRGQAILTDLVEA